jgi:hypothetical protein
MKILRMLQIDQVFLSDSTLIEEGTSARMPAVSPSQKLLPGTEQSPISQTYKNISRIAQDVRLGKGGSYREIEFNWWMIVLTDFELYYSCSRHISALLYKGSRNPR